MLGAFQLGDVETMHKYYADNATFVSGSYAPPVVGWQNYVPIYQSGMSGFQGIQLIRRNTYIYNTADVAWAMYQWEFLSTYNGQAIFGGRPNDTHFRQGGRQMADRAQPHIAGYLRLQRPRSNRPHHNSQGRTRIATAPPNS